MYDHIEQYVMHLIQFVSLVFFHISVVLHEEFFCKY